MRVSVAIDSVDPDALIGFWCAALGYREVGRPGPFRVRAPAGETPPGPLVIGAGGVGSAVAGIAPPFPSDAPTIDYPGGL